MPKAVICRVHGREILDSRGRPTVEAEVWLTDGSHGVASVPSGASTGTSEALELRDGEAGRFAGLGVRQAVANLNGPLATAVNGLPAADQEAVDRAMVEADGTPDKSRLGANAILAVSLASARAAAASADLPLWRWLSQSLFSDREPTIPMPMINILSGGHHAGFQLDIQDVLIIPVGARSAMQVLEWTSSIYLAVRERLRRDYRYTQLVADEGGFGPALSSNEEALGIVTEGIAAAGLMPGRDVRLALDIASSHFYRDGAYQLAADSRRRSASEMIDVLAGWVDSYPVVSIEDGLMEEDWDGWAELTGRLGDRAQILGDDLFTTNLNRLQRGIDAGCANSILIKVNQIGTLTESAACLQAAEAAGFTAVVSTRSGETEDAFITDLAVASAAGQIKPGSIARTERLTKYNQMLRIEETLGTGRFVGARSLSRWL